jgi:hypothetical protein
MTQENKELLLKDLCARLPYGVKVKLGDNPNIFDLKYRIKFAAMYGDSDKLEDILDITNIKPCLFPLSSISEDQKYDFYCRFIKNDCNFDDFKFYLYTGMWRRKLLTLTSIDDIETIIDWFHKNHIDWRGLIPMGLANDATGLNIY